jgi:hypothetical protein
MLGKGFFDLVQQSTDLRSVINIVVGEGRRHDPPGDGIHSDMQLLLGASALGSLFLDQPLTRTTQFHACAVNQQLYLTTGGRRYGRQVHGPGTSTDS